MFNIKKFNLKDIKEVSFIDVDNEDKETTILKSEDIKALYYMKKEKVYVIECNYDNWIFNAASINITY